jgi:amino acid transporter
VETEQRFDHLREHSIGFAQVLFQSITHMAPAAAVAFSLLVGFGFAGPVLPLSVIFALAVGLLIANSVGQLAKQMPSAGGLYTYTSRALGPKVGFLSVGHSCWPNLSSPRSYTSSSPRPLLTPSRTDSA